MPVVTMRNVTRITWGGTPRLHGDAYNHPRFEDGDQIITSQIVRDLGNIVVTRNTIYVLV
jgi:hypothetical protein